MKDEELNKELIQARKGNKEENLQEIRKKMEKSSRLLDGYYNPKIHKKFWQTSGSVKTRLPYSYGDTGLGFNTISKNQENKHPCSGNKEQIHFLEFDYMQNNDIIITIEHCAHCEDHLTHTNHINDIFKNVAKLFQMSIVSRFPFINVYLKPLEKNSSPSRIGAFEIQLGIKLNNNLTITPLFSKLNTGTWPSMYNILNKISTLMPILNIKCILYDKEEGLDTESSNNQVNELLPNKCQNLKINLYHFNNPQIAEYSNQAMIYLDIMFDPKIRQQFLLEQQNNEGIIEDEEAGNYQNSTMKTFSNFGNTLGAGFSASKFSNRPMTGRAGGIKNSSLLFGNRSGIRKDQNSFSKSKFSNNSSALLNSSISTNLSKMGAIEDVDILNKTKGKLLASGYSDKEGVLIFNNVPYDSYLIEVEDNKNFLASGLFIRFNKIFENAPTEKELYTLNKTLGLKRQIDAYLEVFVYYCKSDDELDMELISGANVYLSKGYEASNTSVFLRNDDKIEVNESERIKGRYEIITTPGIMKIFVEMKGYENAEKEINLKCGDNKINIKLEKKKPE